MIYGIKNYNSGSTQVVIKNEGGMILYTESFRCEPDRIQILGSGQTVTVLADSPTSHVGRLITQIDQTNVRMEPIPY